MINIFILLLNSTCDKKTHAQEHTTESNNLEKIITGYLTTNFCI